ncbi:class I SAM-dependent methyltransferase [Thauera mechernichensis]|uniref:Class I SAM-dependent methyltransferase n=1 Tax=Thauera mechernichensis TaxID=82788 RepID=A0ABW3WEY1_9RHOO|nr:methyltransferase domain-containing protein [Thauera mechernichensis]MDG3066768.1 SAM-dependent methyltransferase [Thauera mechernichensis]
MSLSTSNTHAHPGLALPSPWVLRFAPLIPAGSSVLDYACGNGRHARWLASAGYEVAAVDRDSLALEALRDIPGIRTRVLDLEGADWPLAGERYRGVVVTNYLYRPRFGDMLALLGQGDVLIYETFMAGNERFGKPSRADFLLQPMELIDRLEGDWTLVAFEQGEVQGARPAVVQRICAIRGKVEPQLPAA